MSFLRGTLFLLEIVALSVLVGGYTHQEGPTPAPEPWNTNSTIPSPNPSDPSPNPSDPSSPNPTTGPNNPTSHPATAPAPTSPAGSPGAVPGRDIQPSGVPMSNPGISPSAPGSSPSPGYPAGTTWIGIGVALVVGMVLVLVAILCINYCKKGEFEYGRLGIYNVNINDENYSMDMI
eukprot:TRINITY_DN23218_c0_g1_i1.p1 TRINITY_DN23218_c0_g1~~TRINITY_DN23218_c0_g1_i1.p1  ORF type:complete len:177 (-),score=14.60 TRINITY_DN23218_c0_g1_i1:116-646(-)